MYSTNPDNPGHSALSPAEQSLRHEAVLAGAGAGRVLRLVTDVSVVLLPVPQEGEDGVDEKEEN